MVIRALLHAVVMVGMVSGLVANASSDAAEIAYRESLEQLTLGDYGKAIEAANDALRTLSVVTSESKSRALELIANYEVQTGRADLAAQHLAQALAAVSIKYSKNHPVVMKIQRKLKEAEKARAAAQ